MRAAVEMVGEVLRALLLVFACLTLLAGQWEPGGGALALLLLARWLRKAPPAHVQAALDSPAGEELRGLVLEVALRDLLAEAHLRGVPQEAVGVLMEELGAELRQGRAQALAVQYHEGRPRQGGGHRG